MDFFNYQMGKDNWKAVNSFKGKESILNFSKPDKTCTIKIVEKWYGYDRRGNSSGPVRRKEDVRVTYAIGSDSKGPLTATV